MRRSTPTQVMLASAMVEMFTKAGKKEYIGPFAGQVVGLIQDIKPASRILEEMVEQTVDILVRRLPEAVIAKA
jgi:NAD(P)H-dependent flavin oxidoreductase YrpB (nitropropane dioxygenase family)